MVLLCWDNPYIIITPPLNEKPCFEICFHSESGIADSNYVFLPSPPYTLTVPAFQHGSIRFAKSELVPGLETRAEDPMDWATFQMAILGGVDSWNADNSFSSQKIFAAWLY